MKQAYWVYGFLIGYISMQLHEVLHWITAKVFGLGGSVAIFSYSMDSFGKPWQFVVVSLAGAAATILYEVVGLLLLKSKNLLVRRTGFILIVINSVGRVLYEFSDLVIGVSGDEASAAHWMNIPPMYLRLPITLFCILVLLCVLWKDAQTGLRTAGWVTIFITSFIAVIITVLSLGAAIEALISNSNQLFQVNFSGYPIYLLAFNVAMAGALAYMVIQRRKLLNVH